jgi:CxxC motif-containing protein (DUF1111 family)
MKQSILVSSLLSAIALAALAPSVAGAAIGDPVPGLTEEERALFLQGRDLYEHEFTAEEGVGPLFNARACSTCHNAPVTGGGEIDTTHLVTHFGIETFGRFYAAHEFGGPVIDPLSITGEPDGGMCSIAPDTMPVGTPGLIISPRHTPPVFGFGLIDAIPDDELRKLAGRKPWKDTTVAGIAHYGIEMEGIAPITEFTLQPDRKQPIGPARVGRFGWKSQTGTLFQFTAEPFNIELGVSTPFFPREKTPDGKVPLPNGCGLADSQPNDVQSQDTLLLFYFQAFLGAPERAQKNSAISTGEALFRKIGCADCHVEKQRTVDDYYVPWPDGTAHRVEALSHTQLEPWSDFLIHDMGPGLDDHRRMGKAGGRFWRTTPLWGLRFKGRMLHNGSAFTIDEAIAAHGGEGTASRDRYFALPEENQERIDAFLNSL